MISEQHQASMIDRLQELTRCVRLISNRACRGRLEYGEQWAVCKNCEHKYPLQGEVPVLRRDIDAEALRWYDESYADRDRLKDVASNYLKPQRDRVAELAREFRIVGPSLDIGSGTGLFADTVPQYVGLEYSPAALFAKGFEGYARVAADARALPFEDSAFELVISFNVIEHIDDVQKVYEEIDRVLKPGGMMMIKPAWHCRKYTTELIPIRCYSQLNARQQLIKVLLPVLRSKPYKLMTWIPWRSWRRIMARPNNRLRWTQFTPNFGPEWIEDADACSGIDIHETILFFESRGYSTQSHPTLLRKLVAGHDLLVMTKGQRQSLQTT